MTVIAWDGKTLAADRLIGDSGELTKIEWLRGTDTGPLAVFQNAAMGACGDAFQCAALLGHVRDPKNVTLPVVDNATVMFVRKEGIFLHRGFATPIKLPHQIYAIGSGADFALAAMHLGKTAVEAVELACKLSVWCGSGVDAIELTGESWIGASERLK
jgi:hypothetical protein